MWGYIAKVDGKMPYPVVPSLYVRVYRKSRILCRNVICSLIICEGISPIYLTCNFVIWFPHYMWGYIAETVGSTEKRHVPSLYVRVYRWYFCFFLLIKCSLIICEGISSIPRRSSQINTFPHYMWGYIVKMNGFKQKYKVPSLYVRVYRKNTSECRSQQCSLIICEGISAYSSSSASSSAFPHYMWGYIVLIMPIFQVLRVPSLYVRVYRGRIQFRQLV